MTPRRLNLIAAIAFTAWLAIFAAWLYALARVH